MRVPAGIYALAVLAQFAVGAFAFGTAYAAVLWWFRLPASLLVCGAIGAVHGTVVGLVLPVISKFDPGVRSGRMPKPGLFARNFGLLAPPGLVLAHIVYGLIYGMTYAGGRGSFVIGSAWVAGLLGTVGITALVFAGQALGLAAVGTLDFLAASLDAVLRPSAGTNGAPS